MARKHTVKKDSKTTYNVNDSGFSVTTETTEEHIIIDDSPHTFLDEASDDDDDLMFLGSKKKYISSPIDDLADADKEPALIIRVDDDGFW
jgi:hypothetical protein